LGNAIVTVLAKDVVGKTSLVTGSEPIGLLAIGIARLSRATSFFASEVHPLRRSFAMQMVATQTCDPRTVDIVEAVRDDMRGEGVHVLLEMSGIIASRCRVYKH
jgi:threonine dehydrogenase-like Zn-dependent dehydrogenase